jgi:hypothetical protein
LLAQPYTIVCLGIDDQDLQHSDLGCVHTISPAESEVPPRLRREPAKSLGLGGREEKLLISRLKLTEILSRPPAGVIGKDSARTTSQLLVGLSFVLFPTSAIEDAVYLTVNTM